MGAKNRVIAGEYENWQVVRTVKGIVLVHGFTNKIELDKSSVDTYEEVDEEKSTSATSAVGRGLVGSFVLGPVGLLAALSAKKKGVHTVAIQFQDGKKSLLEIDDKIYKKLVTTLF
jgi:hypothetical protein